MDGMSSVDEDDDDIVPCFWAESKFQVRKHTSSIVMRRKPSL